MSEIIEQLRQAFTERFQDDDWHITDVRPSPDERYAGYANVFGTYEVEMTAMRDIDGLNKDGAYNKSPKDTMIVRTIIVFTDGSVCAAYMRILPTPQGGSLRISADLLGKTKNETGWGEMTSSCSSKGYLLEG